MTCCIGKARIYYKEPLGFQLKYQAPGGSWVTITANEPLISTCVQDGDGPPPTPQEQRYGVRFSVHKDNYHYSSGDPLSSDYIVGTGLNILGTIWFSFDTRMALQTQQIEIYQIGTITQTYLVALNGAGDIIWSEVGSTSYYGYSQFSNLSWWLVGENDNERYDPPPTYKFLVEGENTNNIYAFLGGLSACPAVENLGCVMGEEKYIDVDMGKGLLPQLPLFVPDCLIAFAGFPLPDNVIEIRKIGLSAPNTTPGKVKLPQVVLTLTGLDDCPAEFNIICCPDGECDPPKCPPDTDCELDCGNFICCYKNGKVIRTIIKY